MRLAIVTNKPYEECETFIKHQIDCLPYSIKHYWGLKLPFDVARPRTALMRKGLQALGFYNLEADLNLFVKDLIINKIDLVFAHYGMIGDAVLQACDRLGLPLVVHFHGHDAVRKSVLDAYSNYNRLFSYPRLAVVSVSHEMTKRLLSIGCPKDKIHYNVYGPNDAFLELEGKQRKLQFISIGRFVEKKAPHLTLLAFNEVVKHKPDVQLVYAGDGVLLDSCKDLVVALGIEKNVTFPGRITPLDYQGYLEDSLGYVQHSIEAQDGDMKGLLFLF